jgi:hypothetical protein
LEVVLSSRELSGWVADGAGVSPTTLLLATTTTSLLLVVVMEVVLSSRELSGRVADGAGVLFATLLLVIISALVAVMVGSSSRSLLCIKYGSLLLITSNSLVMVLSCISVENCVEECSVPSGGLAVYTVPEVPGEALLRVERSGMLEPAFSVDFSTFVG